MRGSLNCTTERSRDFGVSDEDILKRTLGVIRLLFCLGCIICLFSCGCFLVLTWMACSIKVLLKRRVYIICWFVLWFA